MHDVIRSYPELGFNVSEDEIAKAFSFFKKAEEVNFAKFQDFILFERQKESTNSDLRKTEIWSLGTAVRNPERIPSFLGVVPDGIVWNNDGNNLFFGSLVAARLYKPTETDLDVYSINLLNRDGFLTLDEAMHIIAQKNYTDLPMRGRNAMKPLEKLSLVTVSEDNILSITETGRFLRDGTITFEESVRSALLKIQFPNPRDQSNGKNIKPFVALVHLMWKIDNIASLLGSTKKGISKEEMVIFGLSLVSPRDIDKHVVGVFEYRALLSEAKDVQSKKEIMNKFAEKFLVGVKNIEKNIVEYADNMLRLFRLSGFLYLESEIHNYGNIKLNPYYEEEIRHIIEKDSAYPLKFDSLAHYNKYFGDFGSFFWEEKSFTNNDKEENDLSSGLNKPNESTNKKMSVAEFSAHRTNLLREVEELTAVVERLSVLENHQYGKGAAVELEATSADVLCGFNDDSGLVVPFYKRDDLNKPLTTAPGNSYDIIAIYYNFSLLCEVTMITGRNQYYAEGQPVRRHMEKFMQENEGKETYCLFVAPNLHVDTLNHFFSLSRIYGMHIIPITISQLKAMVTYLCNSSSTAKEHQEKLLGFFRSVSELETDEIQEWIEGIRKNFASIFVN